MLVRIGAATVRNYVCFRCRGVLYGGCTDAHWNTGTLCAATMQSLVAQEQT